MRLMVVCPHFTPDPAPTGEVIGRIVEELAERGHELHVVSALPWYLHHAVEPEWRGRPMRRDRTPWGTVTRVHPFPSDKTSIPRRAVSSAAFCALVEVAAIPGGRMDGGLAMSPPLPLGLVGRGAALAHRAPLVFNVQDVFPDVAVQLGKLTDPRLVRAAEEGRSSILDDYGATSPAEFFAVSTECFFEQPERLLRRHPRLYDMLRTLYGQNPVEWFAGK